MTKLPVLVHLIFHPQSESTRELARYIHQQLNADVIVPGLRLPTVFSPMTADLRPPEKCRLDLAERSFVVPLADNRMSLDDDWCRFVANTRESCQGSPHRCVPIQLDSHAWPLDDRLEGVSFARAYMQPDPESQKEFVVRRIVIELCRYLLSLDSPDDETAAPVRLFLSHTKFDFNVEPRVTQQLIQYLTADQPVEAWVDSGDIPAGSRFAEEIRKGVERTSLLVVLTEQYATREWCRQEVLLAKENHRPVVVVDALTRKEIRSFPYLGNVPVFRWDGNPQKVIDLVLKETLRHLHMMLVLNQTKLADEIPFVRPPELVTLVGLPPGSAVLYPDPPIGVEEKTLLAKTNVPFTTHLERLAIEQSLDGKLVALSMSESTDIARGDLDSIHLESAMLEFSRYLLINGATLAYGGHLGAEGYTQKLFELVRTHNSRKGVPPFDRIINFRGWPLPRLNIDQLAELKPLARTRELPRPEGIDETLHAEFTETPKFFPGDKSALHRFAWARGMTDMREYQSDFSKSGIAARIVLGGTFGPTVKTADDGSRKEIWYFGRIPGVLEEVMLSVRAGQPVFLIGGFGGVAGLVIDLLEGIDREEATWEYQSRAPFAPEMKKLYESAGLEWWDYPEMVGLLRQKGIAGINPCLTEDEHRELFRTIDPVQMIELVLLGLSRLAQV